MTDSDGNADRVVVFGIAAIGIVHLVTAAWMVIAPRSFFEHIATFGEYNSHFQNDIAAFEAGLGMALLAAVKWPALRIGAVAATFATTTLHAINHWFDINAANAGSHADVFGAIAVTALAIATGWLLFALTRSAA